MLFGKLFSSTSTAAVSVVTIMMLMSGGDASSAMTIRKGAVLSTDSDIGRNLLSKARSLENNNNNGYT